MKKLNLIHVYLIESVEADCGFGLFSIWI